MSRRMNHSVLVKKPVGDVLSPAANAAVQASKYAGRATGLLPVNVPDEPHAATDLKLLEAAGEVFADKGYRAATIREIIRRAQVNIAAVNYHYGDKQNLYAAVFRYARKCCEERFPLPGLPNSQSKHICL